VFLRSCGGPSSVVSVIFFQLGLNSHLEVAGCSIVEDLAVEELESSLEGEVRRLQIGRMRGRIVVVPLMTLRATHNPFLL
jgi:hypothetical protein